MAGLKSPDSNSSRAIAEPRDRAAVSANTADCALEREWRKFLLPTVVFHILAVATFALMVFFVGAMVLSVFIALDADLKGSMWNGL